VELAPPVAAESDEDEPGGAEPRAPTVLHRETEKLAEEVVNESRIRLDRLLPRGALDMAGLEGVVTKSQVLTE
jgi:hypothetical protein